MDIDTELPLDTNSHFSIVFPLPYRCLCLVGIGILGWASNLQGLYFLGIDTGYALNIRSTNTGLRTREGLATTFAHPSTLYKPVYRLFLIYAVITLTSWLFFFLSSSGASPTTDSVKFIPSLTIISLLILLMAPWSILYRRERATFLRASLRCLVPSFTQSIYFSDIILADIFTSFAKVFGDFWLASIILISNGHLWQLPEETGLTQWITPCLMSLPYAVRLRQCIAEYVVTSSKRSLYNALKYFTAFPVIFLSAAQRLVNDEKPHGEHPLFRVWVFFVFVNSIYSFWWDVTNDWGLTMFTFSSRKSKRKLSTPATPMESRDRLISPYGSTAALNAAGEDDLDGPSQAPGLRSHLLFSDPMIYYIAVFINFVLRFTWSLKLSSHLHHVADLEAGVFLIEGLEVLRRWIWVFLRVEWETLKLGKQPHNDEYEFLMREVGEEDVSDVSM